jgi:hypothetical protein
MMALDELRVLAGQDAIRRRQKQRDPGVDKIDLRERERDLPAQHDPLVEQVIDDVEQRLVLGTENALRFGGSVRICLSTGVQATTSLVEG